MASSSALRFKGRFRFPLNDIVLLVTTWYCGRQGLNASRLLAPQGQAGVAVSLTAVSLDISGRDKENPLLGSTGLIRFSTRAKELISS